MSFYLARFASGSCALLLLPQLLPLLFPLLPLLLQVSFHSDKPIRKYTVLERDRETLRRLEKSKEEKYPDLAAERKRRGECQCLGGSPRRRSSHA